LKKTALANGQAVGWHQGRMEFGPRSLGNRSILDNPRSPTMQRALNLKVEYRERGADVKSYRCRKMSAEEQGLFGIDKLNVVRSDIPAVTHADYSARIQTVHKETNPRYHALIGRFEELTGCPVLINTSFNMRGEP
jgi:carbamoyltransferase